MLELSRIDFPNQDFKSLVSELDAHLAVTDEDEHDFYDQYNKVDQIKHIVIAFENDKPVACGALKEYDKENMEVKRMYTIPESRGNGIATRILAELEKWSVELGYKYCMLETGTRQPDAIALYKKCKYQIIDNYGQYIGVENSVCFRKNIVSNRGGYLL